MTNLRQKNLNFVLNIVVYIAIGLLINSTAGFETASIILLSILISSTMSNS